MGQNFIDSYCPSNTFSPDKVDGLAVLEAPDEAKNVSLEKPAGNDFNQILTSFICCYNLTNNCIDDLLELLKYSTDLDKANIPSSRYILFDINGLKKNISSSFYCNCFKLFESSSIHCNICNHLASNCFLKFNLKECISKFCLKFLVTSDNSYRFRRCIYTDGISKCRHSKRSVWPVYLVSTDLPYSMRYKLENIVILGIYYGEIKPDIQLFLKEIFQEFFHSGNLFFYFLDLKFYIDILFLTADKPARSLLLNSQTFNSKYFCPICLCTTKVCTKGLKRKIFVPLENNLSSILRNKENTIALIYSAHSTSLPEYGFKGKSFLFNLNSFIPSKSIIIDYMHDICSGIFKTLISFMFFEKFDTSLPPLKDFMKDYDKISSQFKPCQFLPKETPLLSKFKLWKSKDFKTFIFFIFPIFRLNETIAQRKLWSTIMLIRNSIFLLLSENLSNTQLDIIGKNIESFFIDLTSIFDETILKPNFHDLCHIIENYKNSGPLYNFSGFNFEHINGILSRLSHGNKRLDFQIAKNIHLLTKIHYDRSKNLKKDNPSSKQWKPSKKIASDIFFSGKYVKINNTMIPEYNFPELHENNSFLDFKRVTFRYFKISTNLYDKKKIFTFSSFFNPEESIFFEVNKILCTDLEPCNEKCYILGKEYEIENFNTGIFRILDNPVFKFYTIKNFIHKFSMCSRCMEFIFALPKSEMF